MNRLLSFSSSLLLCLPLCLLVEVSGLAMPQAGSPGKAQAQTGAGEVATPKRPPKPEAVQAMNRGQELLFRKNDPEGGVREFKKALQIDPWYGQGYILLGVAYMQLQRWNTAQFAFEEAVKVEPDNAQAFLGLGSALNEQREYSAAQKALEHSLDLKPNSAEAHYELARTLGALGKWQAAEPHARRAIEINPDYPGSHALLGNVYLDEQDINAALKEFRTYLQMAPEGSLAPTVRQKISEIEAATGQPLKR
jgi:tetratricopeptide (TPR) repeat protein